MKCVRFPNDVIADVDKLIIGRDCTFSAFVVEAVRVAIDAVRLEEMENAATAVSTERYGKS